MLLFMRKLDNSDRSLFCSVVCIAGANAAVSRCEQFVSWWVGCLVIQLQRILEPVRGLKVGKPWHGLHWRGLRERTELVYQEMVV